MGFRGFSVGFTWVFTELKRPLPVFLQGLCDVLVAF